MHAADPATPAAAAFDFSGLLGTVIALVVVSLMVDGAGAWARRSLR